MAGQKGIIMNFSNGTVKLHIPEPRRLYCGEITSVYPELDIAVLRSALIDVAMKARSEEQRQDVLVTAFWIWGDYDHWRVFAFEELCSRLGLNHDYLRAVIWSSLHPHRQLEIKLAFDSICVELKTGLL